MPGGRWRTASVRLTGIVGPDGVERRENGPMEQPADHDMASPGGQCYLIFYFDVLGFSARVRDIGLQRIRAVYENLVEMIDGRRGGQLVRGGTTVPATFVMSWESTYFSDSILVWTPYPTPDILDPAIYMARRLYCECLARGLPLRGAMAAGEAVMDRDRGIYLGEPLIDAVRAEAAQRWSGLGVASSWPAQFGGALGRADGFLPYEEHAKPGSEHALTKVALDWPRLWRTAEECQSMDLRELIGAYRTSGRTDYWDATLRFVEHSATSSEWWVDHDFQDHPAECDGDPTSSWFLAVRGCRGG